MTRVVSRFQLEATFTHLVAAHGGGQRQLLASVRVRDSVSSVGKTFGVATPTVVVAQLRMSPPTLYTSAVKLSTNTASMSLLGGCFDSSRAENNVVLFRKDGYRPPVQANVVSATR